MLDRLRKEIADLNQKDIELTYKFRDLREGGRGPVRAGDVLDEVSQQRDEVGKQLTALYEQLEKAELELMSHTPSPTVPVGK